MQFSFEPIGFIESCYKDKFGVPRQPGLVDAAEGRLTLLPPYNRQEAVFGLDAFSHVWISFVFHQCLGQQARLSVRPPRLGGNKKVGVFASRATHRPNPLGLSVVELRGVECSSEGVFLRLGGLDLVDGTPVLDIKPYLPYTDVIEGAHGGFASDAPTARLEVEFAPQALEACGLMAARLPNLRQLIEQVLSLDPRPAYMQGRDCESDRVFGVRLYDLDVRWQVQGGQVQVIEIVVAANQT